jgi:imidazoleglycerol-phosphate dehydratase
LRIGKFERETFETKIKVEINLDGSGKTDIRTPVEFFNHMLTSLATHSMIDMKIEAKGDLKHHIIEDTAIGLGSALRNALTNNGNVSRFGFAIVPMDCSLANCAVDLGNRPYSVVDVETESKVIEDTAVEDLIHFFESLAVSMRANIHIKVEYGGNDHHKMEAAFKALALSLRQAISIDPRREDVPSSKGVL